jgi:hypothetical protein
MRKALTALAAVTGSGAALTIAAAPATASLPIPKLPPAGSFAARVDNPWFPLIPGTTFEYHGEKDGKPGRDVLMVTHRHRSVLGISATVVADRLYLNGRLAERTTDWYAQDKRGNVWYLGENTATLSAHGTTLSIEGTWLAGAHGARAGIYMPAHPKPGDTGRQEFYRGHAEDQFRVLNLDARVRTPAVSSRRALLTQETTRLEPGAVDHKLYVRGVGTVVERAVRGGSERFELVSVKRP